MPLLNGVIGRRQALYEAIRSPAYGRARLADASSSGILLGLEKLRSNFLLQVQALH